MKLRSLLCTVLICVLLGGEALPPADSTPKVLNGTYVSDDSTEETLPLSVILANHTVEDHQANSNISHNSAVIEAGEPSNAFDKYIEDLSDLLSALNDPDYDWDTDIPILTLPSSSPALHVEDDEYDSGIQGLFAFVGTMKRWSKKFLGFRENTPNPEGDSNERLPTQELKQENDNLLSNVTGEDGGQEEAAEGSLILTSNSMTVKSQNDLSTFTGAMEELSRVYNQYFNKSREESMDSTVSDRSSDGLLALIHTLETLAEAHATFHGHLLVAEPNYLNPQDTHARLLQIVEELKKLVEHSEDGEPPVTLTPPPPPTAAATTTTTAATTTTTTATATTTTTTTTTISIVNFPLDFIPKEPGNYLPCEEPYEEIAYRMCILQITDKKLSWPAAWEYCWSRGAVLVQDPVVVKTRRHLDQLYGEYGSRVRWPIWVGGKEIVEGGNKVWKWADGSLVPQFLWNEGQPRHYSRLHAPLGSCMFLDGYKNFYASSLPCHLKRRFVCQRRE